MFLGVTGNPISHSKSPPLHKGCIAGGCESIRIAASTIKEAIEVCVGLKFSGLNITAPFKEDAFNFVIPEASADSVKCINTIKFSGDKLFGYNTDIVGIKKSLAPHLADDKKIIILGAGGAARAAAVAVKELNKDCIILNRTLDKAKSLALEFNHSYGDLNTISQQLKTHHIVISTVPSPENFINNDWLTSTHVILDANYKSDSELVKSNAIYLDGLHWLKYQGIAACEIFSGSKINEDEIDFNPILKPLKRSNKIALTGMMGSGKSTVAHLLQNIAKKHAVEIPIIDTDAEIEQSESKKIAEIISGNGLPYFRDLEKSIVQKACSLNTATIISLGGGAILDPDSLKLLTENTNLIYLWAKPETLAKRVNNDLNRPLLTTHEDPLTSLQKIAESRKEFYLKADMLLSTEHNSAQQVAERIFKEYIEKKVI